MKNKIKQKITGLMNIKSQTISQNLDKNLANSGWAVFRLPFFNNLFELS